MNDLNIEMKRCIMCGKLKPLPEFHKKRDGKYGVQSRCKKCQKDCAAEYYNNNKKYIKEKSTEYRKKNSKRTAIRNSLNSHKKKYDVIITLDECFEMDNEYCFYCGCKLEWEYGIGHSIRSPTIDRCDNENILTKDNIVFACYACNSGKYIGTMEEYIERCERVVVNKENILKRR